MGREENTPQSSRNPCGHNDVKCKLIVAYVSLSSYFFYNMIDINSRHVAVAFNIPVHNISIYFDKLYSLKFLVVLFGTLIEYGIFQAAGADRDPEDLNSGKRVRRYVNIILLFIILLLRIFIFVILFFSKQLAYHFYLLKSMESFFFGPFDNSFVALSAQYIPIVSSLFHIARIFIFAIQFILDLIWYNNPLLMVKMMFFICALMTTVSLFLLYYLNFHLKVEHFNPLPREEAEKHTHTEEPAKSLIDMITSKSSTSKTHTSQNKSQTSQKDESECISNLCEECKKRIGNDAIGTLISPMLMNYTTSVITDFLYPGTLPYALLQRDKCHVINMLIPFFTSTGPLLYVVIDSFTDYMRCWSWFLDSFWLTFIPLPFIYVCSFMAIHTRTPLAIKIRSSRPIVMAMSFTMMLGYGFLEGLAYIGVGLYAVRGNPKGYTIQGIDLILLMTIRTVISKVSVGYTDIRISLGYHLPKFRPNHRMSKSNTFWYIFKNTFRRAGIDTINDFKMNIKDYL